MNLFGTQLETAQIAALVGLLATLALWLIVLGRQRGYESWFRKWEADRKARLETEQGKSEPKREPTGPWG